MEVCTGEVTIGLPGLRATRYALSAARAGAEGSSHDVIDDHRPPVRLVVFGR
jgi:hypothetical protein